MAHAVKKQDFMKQNIQKNRFCCLRDGLRIRGLEYRPTGDNLPIAVVCHGFMANYSTVKHYAKHLARLGYAAFCFDFCGGSLWIGKSDGKTTDMSVLTEIEDLKAVIEYAKSREYTDSDKLLLMGCSQGGFVSALTAARLCESVSKLVLFYPALCIPDDARRGKMMLAEFDPQDLPDIVKCGPMKLGRKYVEDVINMHPCEEITAYSGDVLVVHGTRDGIVNISYAEEAVRAYAARETCGRVEYYPIEGARHMFSGRYDRMAMDRITSFLTDLSDG